MTSCVSHSSEAELEATVEKALTFLFSTGHDECSIGEVFRQVGRDPCATAVGQAAVIRALDAMEAANMGVMHREGRVHLLK